MLRRWADRWGLRSIRARLIVTYTLLILVSFSLLGWFMYQALDRFYMTRLQADMFVEASLMAEQGANTLVRGGRIELPALLVDPPPPLQSQARVLLFDGSGRLLGTSDPALDDLLDQPLAEPGLDDALAGHAAQGVELSTAAGVPVAFVAQPVVSAGRVVGAVHLAYTLADIQNAQRTLSVAIIGATASVALIIGLFSLWLTRSITAPLARLSFATAEIASGHFDRRVPEAGPSEVAALARNFNQMVEALQRTDHDRRIAFAHIAHDVRTPLGSMQAAVEALSAGAIEQPRLRQRLLSGLVDQAQYLGRLTDNLLRLAAYEGGSLVLRRSRVDVLPLVRQAVRAMEPRAQAHTISLAIDVPDACPPVWADADRVLECLFNLLDNALIYTPPGGSIQTCVQVDTLHAQAWLHVRDTGPGFSAEAVPDDLGPHWRGGRVTGGRQGTSLNMGLGLNIVRAIVRAHGGNLAFGNGPRGGADISFSLPLAA